LAEAIAIGDVVIDCLLTACGELQDFFASSKDGNVRLMKIGIVDGSSLTLH